MCEKAEKFEHRVITSKACCIGAVVGNGKNYGACFVSAILISVLHEKFIIFLN